MASGSDNSGPVRWPRSAERGNGKAATAAAGRVGCAATVSRPLGRGLDTGLAALLDHRDSAVALAGPRSLIPGRASPGCVPRNAEGEGNYRSPWQEPADRDRSARPAYAVGEPSPARAGGRHARTAVCRAFPPVRVDLAPEEMAGLAEQPIIVVAWAAVPDEAHARSRRDRPAGYHSTGGGPVPGSQGDHRIVALEVNSRILHAQVSGRSDEYLARCPRNSVVSQAE
jgi:hypothetical protein